jgi:Ca-activated chloride channel homolog
MMEIGALAFLRPWWLAAAPLIAALGWYISRQANGLEAWERAIDAPLLAAMRRLGRVLPGAAQRDWFAAALAGSIAVALSGPATKSADLTAFRNLDGLVIAADLSRSVTGGGNLPMALSAARVVAEGAGSRPVALVVYGQDAYAASNFTIDARALGTTIAVLDAETVPGAGSRPERALAMARGMLAETHTLAGDVVLVSDGGGLSDAAFEEARSITALGARVSTLLVPRADGGEAPPPDPAALASLAVSGGGLSADAMDPSAIARLVGNPSATRLAASDFSVLAWNDHGRWLLVLALLAALPLFRRRA